METNYSNRELDEKFKELTEYLKRIELQTMKTNGSVANLKKWQERLIGGVGVIIVIGLPIISWTLLTAINNSSNLAVVNSKIYTITHVTK